MTVGCYDYNDYQYKLQNSRDLFRLVFPAAHHFRHIRVNSINVCWMMELNGKLSWWQIMIRAASRPAAKVIFSAPSFPRQSLRSPLLVSTLVWQPQGPPPGSPTQPLQATGPSPSQCIWSCIWPSHLSTCTFWALPCLPAGILESYGPGLNPDIQSSLAVAEWDAWYADY